MTDFEQNKINEISKLIIDGKLSNEFLFSSLKLSEEYLNLKRVSTFAKENGKSTQGLRGSKNIITICGYQLIIDNE